MELLVMLLVHLEIKSNSALTSVGKCHVQVFSAEHTDTDWIKHCVICTLYTFHFVENDLNRVNVLSGTETGRDLSTGMKCCNISYHCLPVREMWKKTHGNITAVASGAEQKEIVSAWILDLQRKHNRTEWCREIGAVVTPHCYHFSP